MPRGRAGLSGVCFSGIARARVAGAGVAGAGVPGAGVPGAVGGLLEEVIATPNNASRTPPSIRAAKLAASFPREGCIVSSRSSSSPSLRECATADDYLPANITRKMPEVNHKNLKTVAGRAPRGGVSGEGRRRQGRRDKGGGIVDGKGRKRLDGRRPNRHDATANPRRSHKFTWLFFLC